MCSFCIEWMRVRGIGKRSKKCCHLAGVCPEIVVWVDVCLGLWHLQWTCSTRLEVSGDGGSRRPFFSIREEGSQGFRRVGGGGKDCRVRCDICRGNLESVNNPAALNYFCRITSIFCPCAWYLYFSFPVSTCSWICLIVIANASAR